MPLAHMWGKYITALPLPSHTHILSLSLSLAFVLSTLYDCFIRERKKNMSVYGYGDYQSSN